MIVFFIRVFLTQTWNVKDSIIWHKPLSEIHCIFFYFDLGRLWRKYKTKRKNEEEVRPFQSSKSLLRLKYFFRESVGLSCDAVHLKCDHFFIFFPLTKIQNYKNSQEFLYVLYSIIQGLPWAEPDQVTPASGSEKGGW